MTLAAGMVARYFKSSTVSLGLMLNGLELSLIDGYQRAARPPLEIHGAQATVSAEWGPFTHPVRFNEAVLYDGDSPVERYPIGEFSLPAGAVHRSELVVEVT